MSRSSNNTSSFDTQSTKKKATFLENIKSICNSAIFIICVIFLVVGISLLLVGTIIIPEIYSIAREICITMGATAISVVLINVTYQFWQDHKLESKIQSIEQDIPQLVRQEIETHIEIGKKNLNRLAPGIPENIIKPGKRENDPIVKELIESLCPNNNRYYYVGIGMTTMAKAIEQLKETQLQYVYFLIPNPQKGIVSDGCVSNMKKSIETILKVWEDPSRSLNIEFVLLNDLPLFHIHKTETDCWFAFVDLDRKENYPVTYQYKKDRDKGNDGLEMYHTIAKMVDKLYAKNKTDVCYIFDFDKKVKKGKKCIKKENFIDLFNTRTKVKRTKVRKNESHS
ncbi:MAG: hypothetical protein J6S03_02990 [Bacteroidaceae bacterium]|nr:hypothetical protein [Bacteroidaceae bacterium]